MFQGYCSLLKKIFVFLINTAQKQGYALKISSLNVTNFAGDKIRGYGHIY